MKVISIPIVLRQHIKSKVDINYEVIATQINNSLGKALGPTSFWLLKPTNIPECNKCRGIIPTH